MKVSRIWGGAASQQVEHLLIVNWEKQRILFAVADLPELLRSELCLFCFFLHPEVEELDRLVTAKAGFKRYVTSMLTHLNLVLAKCDSCCLCWPRLP